MAGRWPPGLPDAVRTVRVRLAVTYSVLVFGIGALVLGVVYLSLSSTVDAEPLDPLLVKRYVKNPDGTLEVREGEKFEAADLASVQKAVNQGTLDTLRTYSFAGLGGLFLVSLGVGWLVAGRVLRPLGAITTTAREISATDLSRRIEADGPHDELRTLADTIDGMLDRLERAFADQRALVDDVSHELRNPVAVVRANLDAVLADDQAGVEDRRHAVDIVRRAIADMTRLIDDLLAHARHRSGAFAETDLDLAQLATGAVAEYRRVAEERRVGLALRLAEGPTVFADEDALVRAVRNLVSNAVRFSAPGSEVTVAVGSRRGWAWVAVRDEGPGIAADDRDRVFDRFYTAEAVTLGGASTTGGPQTATRTRGNGLGLAIARQIVEAHDGRLAAFSELGVGSTFVIWLPDRTAVGVEDRDEVPPGDDPLGRRR